MSIMNPYEAPSPADDRMPTQRRRKLIVGVAMAVGAGMIIGGMAMFYVVRIQATRAAQAEFMRARQAAEVAERRAQESALKAESQRKHEQRTTNAAARSQSTVVDP